ncbi:hypothetical protein [Pontibacillus salipaludis]|uniref:Uncharacterized protein n=1 Tax=Pontibacillus salipaludis TaxID=1697394 RepID=A0ABQ1Q1I3_9BACI|nr:hypothetical protein [Pontibacillus salipaludis]GGD09802.1 hypothetical protein GCM10011389_16630 [Pontibacillus salipaludis]
MGKWLKMMLIFLLFIVLSTFLLYILNIHFPPYTYTFSEETGDLTVEHIFDEEETYVLKDEKSRIIGTKVMVNINESRTLIKMLFSFSILMFNILWILYLTLRNSRYFKMAMYIYGAVALFLVGFVAVQYVEVYQSFAPLLEEVRTISGDR